ncbi:MAG: hypothetical protein ABIS86_19945 [Streptosporangiaceae bacterium]
MSVSELAQILFASELQESAHPTPDQIRDAIDRLQSCSADCAACVAQEAGDHPEAYAARMLWALAQVNRMNLDGPPT